MAKQNPSAPVDEQFLMDVIAGGFSTKKETPEPAKEPESIQPEEQEEPEIIVVEEKRIEEKPKESAKRKRTTTVDYEAVFLQRNELKARQSVYVSKEIHEKVSKIASVLGGKDLSVGGYIDNVLSQHFDTFMDEINALYEKKYAKLF